MSDLAQQCQKISNQRGPCSVGELIAHKRTLLAYISELQSELAALRKPANDNKAAQLSGFLTVMSSYPHITGDQADKLRSAASALDHSEREKAVLAEALKWACDQMCGHGRSILEVDRVMEVTQPQHAHLRPILLQYAGSKQA